MWSAVQWSLSADLETRGQDVIRLVWTVLRDLEVYRWTDYSLLTQDCLYWNCGDWGHLSKRKIEKERNKKREGQNQQYFCRAFNIHNRHLFAWCWWSTPLPPFSFATATLCVPLCRASSWNRKWNNWNYQPAGSAGLLLSLTNSSMIPKTVVRTSSTRTTSHFWAQCSGNAL